jgi:hypothetical protein
MDLSKLSGVPIPGVRVCSECAMKFDTDEELVNHKEMFCKDSIYFDGDALLEQVSAVPLSRTMNFDDVRKYVSARDEVDRKDKRIGKQTLLDLKKNINEAEVDTLRDQLIKKKETEKADEMRRYKVLTLHYFCLVVWRREGGTYHYD